MGVTGAANCHLCRLAGAHEPTCFGIVVSALALELYPGGGFELERRPGSAFELRLGAVFWRPERERRRPGWRGRRRGPAGLWIAR